MANLASRTKISLWKLSVFTSGNPVGPFRIRFKYLGNQLCRLGQDLCREVVYLSLIFGRERHNCTCTKSKLSHPFLGYDIEKEKNINAIFFLKKRISKNHSSTASVVRVPSRKYACYNQILTLLQSV